MLWEMDISIISGQMALLHVRLEPGDGFEVYGGTSEDALRVERQDDEWLVTLDEVDVAGRPLVRFNVYARQVSTGREWVIFGGKVLVSQRTATAPGDKLAPVEYFVKVPVLENAVDLTGTALVTGIVGPRGYSAYDIAVMEGFEGTEPEWLEYMRQQTATLAVEQVTPLMERAETAADKSEREAAAAKTAQETAAAHAKAAKESELAASGHKTAAAAEVTKAATEVQKAAAEVDKARQERETAAGHANAAAKSAQDAETAKTGAEQAARDAQTAKSGAEQAAANADASKSAAQTAEGNAKASADAAAADKAAAAQAKQDAQAAQTKAEKEALKAEQNAALLGDAALKGGDNEFTGENTFSGVTLGLMPPDFMKYAWVEDAATLEAVCEDLRTRKTWYFYTPKLLMNFGFNGGGSGMKASVFEDIVFYSEVASPHSYYSLLGFNKANMRRLVLVLPEYMGRLNPVSNNWVGGEFNIEKCEVYAPRATCFGFRRACVASLLMVCANTEINESAFDVTSCISSLRRVSFPGNVVNRVVMTKLKGLREVLTDFPLATVINFQNAKLDKASVLRIVNGLQTYDSATMETVPDLTIGIDPALDGDEEINAALLNAQESVENGGKGWNVAVAGFTVTAGGGTTMALRKPIYAAAREDAEGAYIDADGTRWSVRYGRSVFENWAANEELGYTEFPTIEAALEEWGLIEYVPELEETLTNE